MNSQYGSNDNPTRKDINKASLRLSNLIFQRLFDQHSPLLQQSHYQQRQVTTGPAAANQPAQEPEPGHGECVRTVTGVQQQQQPQQQPTRPQPEVPPSTQTTHADAQVPSNDEEDITDTNDPGTGSR